MKKRVWLLLSILLIVAATMLPVLATDPGGVAAGEVTCLAGETVDIYVSAHDYYQVTTLATTFNEIPEGLSYKSAEWLVSGVIEKVDTAKKAGAWMANSPMNFGESTNIFKITYTVSPDARGTIQFNITVKVKTDAASEQDVYTVPVTVNVLAPATGVTLNQNTLTLDLSGTKSQVLTAQTQPANTTDPISWSSTDNSVAAVDTNGNVTALKIGNAQIKVTAGNFSAVCDVTVVCTHQNATHYTAKTADCANPGNYEYYHCDACNQYLKADKQTATTYEAEQIAKLGHNTTHNPKVDATCTATGTKENWYCDRCQKAYSDSQCTAVLADTVIPVDAQNHTGTASWTQHLTQHSKAYTCCGAVVVALENHQWANGVCVACSYTCSHTGGTATCTQKAICDNCKYAYGTVNAQNHTGAATWQQDATQHSKTYDCCGAAVVAKEEHEWADGVCTECSYTCSHTGGTATCKNKAECTVCKSAYGEVNPNNHEQEAAWTQNATQHSKTYGCCGVVVVAQKNHEWVNGVCSECAYTCGHTGGTATCTQKAVCTICQIAYGKTDISNHTGTAQWKWDETNHSKLYNCCNSAEVANEPHEWENGVCVECNYTCSHTGGTATCVKKAVCDICKSAYGAVNPANHAGETVLKNAVTPSCYEGGYSGDTYCKDCDALITAGRDMAPTGNHVAKEPWLKDDTSHWHACSTPGCSAQVDKAEHRYQWKCDKEATEVATGLKHEECVCGVKRNEGTVIPKLDHVHGNIQHHAAVPATCTKEGTVEYWTCGKSLCAGKFYGDANCQLLLDTVKEAMNPQNHAGGTVVKNAIAASCYRDGYTGDTYCKGCGAKTVTGSVVYATGEHKGVGNWLTDGTYHWHACATSGCSAQVDKAAHSFSWVVDKKPTEEAEGVKHEACGCGLKRNENTKIQKLEHIPVLVAGVENTCTEDGVQIHYYCQNCGRYYAYNDGKIGEQISAEATILKATGHSYDEAWESDETHHWHVCHCGEIADKTVHTAQLQGAVEATKEEPGYTGDFICADCGYEIKKGEVIPSKQDAVLENIQNAQNGSSVQIGVPEDDGTLSAIVSAEVLEAAKGKDVLLVLDMGKYQWIIQGNTITGTDLQDIDLKVELDTQRIPADVISTVAKTEKTLQLSLTHNGEFGFAAKLSVDLGKENAGKVGKLYYYNADKELELIGSGEIGKDGKILLPFSHASDYVIVIEAAASNLVLWIVLAVAVIGAAAVVLILRKKRNQ